MKVLTIAEWQPPQLPEPRTPGERRRLSRLQTKAEQAVDRLLALLDELAGDPDLEDGADDEDGGDDEFSLGSLDRMIDQRRWSEGETGDLEAGDEKEGDELDTREASEEEVQGEGSDQGVYGENAVAPDPEYRERLHQRRGERPKRRRPAFCTVTMPDGSPVAPDEVTARSNVEVLS